MRRVELVTPVHTRRVVGEDSVHLEVSTVNQGAGLETECESRGIENVTPVTIVTIVTIA